MEPVIEGKTLPAGYRRAGRQAVRVDMAEKLFRAAHERRAATAGRSFVFDEALARSMGLKPESFASLMRDAGFRANQPRKLSDGVHGPPAPALWSWRPPRKDRQPRRNAPSGAAPTGAFAALAELVR